jgi:hypothetical protein
MWAFLRKGNYKFSRIAKQDKAKKNDPTKGHFWFGLGVVDKIQLGHDSTPSIRN